MSETRSVIVVGVDGSEGSERAVRWCAETAPVLGAEVVAVHALSVPFAALPPLEVSSVPVVDQEWKDELSITLENEWCAPLRGVAHRSQIAEGSPAHVILEAARAENARLIVVGSRGKGGFTELLLGSVSHQLAHHVDRPLVIIPPPRD